MPVLEELVILADRASERKGHSAERLDETAVDQRGERVELSSGLSRED